MFIQSAQKYWLFHPNVAQYWFGNSHAIFFKALVYDAFAAFQDKFRVSSRKAVSNFLTPTIHPIWIISEKVRSLHMTEAFAVGGFQRGIVCWHTRRF